MLTRHDSNSSEDAARSGHSIVIGKRQLRSGKVDVLYNAEQQQAQAITSPLPDSGEDDDITFEKDPRQVINTSLSKTFEGPLSPAESTYGGTLPPKLTPVLQYPASAQRIAQAPVVAAPTAPTANIIFNPGQTIQQAGPVITPPAPQPVAPIVAPVPPPPPPPVVVPPPPAVLPNIVMAEERVLHSFGQ